MKDKEKIFKALANHRRLQILIFVDKRKAATVDEIAKHLRLSFKSTSKHLKVLTNSNFLDWEQRSSNRFYFLTGEHADYLKLFI